MQLRSCDTQPLHEGRLIAYELNKLSVVLRDAARQVGSALFRYYFEPIRREELMRIVRPLLEMIPGGTFVAHPKIPAVIALGALGMGYMAIHEYNPFGIENTADISAGHGTLEKVYELPFPKECTDAFVSKVDDASAEYSKQVTFNAFGLHASAPIGYSDTETFNGDITSEVCRDSTKVKVMLNTQTKKVKVSLPGDAYHTTVYMTDPASAPFTTEHNGPTNAAVKIFETEAHALPGVTYQGVTDSLTGRLRGYAYLAAQKTASEGCGTTAWKYLKPMESDSIKTEVVNWAHALNPDLGHLATKDVTVDLPDHAAMTSQYGNKLEQIKAEAGDNLTINVPASAGDCQASPTLDKFMQQHPNGGQQ